MSQIHAAERLGEHHGFLAGLFFDGSRRIFRVSRHVNNFRFGPNLRHDCRQFPAAQPGHNHIGDEQDESALRAGGRSPWRQRRRAPRARCIPPRSEIRARFPRTSFSSSASRIVSEPAKRRFLPRPAAGVTRRSAARAASKPGRWCRDSFRCSPRCSRRSASPRRIRSPGPGRCPCRLPW